MATPLLQTKLSISATRPKLFPRPLLSERLNEGLDRKLTLISAPAGFGKTTLVSERAVGCGQLVAWLSLDEGDNELARFLACLVAALQTIEGNFGQGLLATPQPLGTVNVESVLITLP